MIGLNETSQLIASARQRNQSTRLIGFKFYSVQIHFCTVYSFAETSTTIASDQMSEVVFNGFDFVLHEYTQTEHAASSVLVVGISQVFIVS